MLPAAGRVGSAPEWPLAEAPAAELGERELVLWEREWRRPQAILWERNGQELEVALYVRAVADAERFGASVSARTLVKQLQEALGLSVPGLLRNRWRIEADAQAEAGGPAPVPGSTAKKGARDRFTVVDGGGGA